MPSPAYLPVNMTFTIDHVLSVSVGERDERGDDSRAGSIRDVVIGTGAQVVDRLVRFRAAPTGKLGVRGAIGAGSRPN